METLISSKITYYVNDVEHGFCKELLRHGNLVVKVMQYDGSSVSQQSLEVGRPNMGMKIMGLVVYNVAWKEAYHRTKWHLDPQTCLATTDMGRKVGRGTVPPF